ncbi:hypothetical protein [Azospirillum sp. TSO22-1]|uniref:hypothetical protein n=1 Tax=Azospirillum sp. TSO22-1 TaxID=716789 RepID=UPI000D622C0E|nr:hypothetical protein [Azospirillum sp. TSO22-1]PWC41380.1 hypothetical protein TSO221_23480 [Azospirillum sp. TSO22-1]
MVRTLFLAILVFAAGPAAAADWYAVDASRVRIAVKHPAFAGQAPAVSVRIPDDIARTAQSDWLRLGSLAEPGPVFTATYQTEHRGFPPYTLAESFRHKMAFRAWTTIAVADGPTVRSDFGPVETMKVTIARDGVERQCGYWHWQESDNRSYFDGWYCPAVGQEVGDADIQRSVWAVRWRTQEARAP